MIVMWPRTSPKQPNVNLHSSSSHGFRLVEATDHVVRFESPVVSVRASYYPSEMQVDVQAARLDQRDRYAELVLSGMVGRASPARLLELAAEQLRANVPALTGDPEYYACRGAERRAEAEALTAYAERKRPHPRGKLP